MNRLRFQRCISLVQRKQMFVRTRERERCLAGNWDKLGWIGELEEIFQRQIFKRMNKKKIGGMNVIGYEFEKDGCDWVKVRGDAYIRV